MKEDIIKILLEYRDRIYDGNSDQAAKSLGVNPPTFWRWLNGKNIPKVESISRAFDMLNATIVLPGKEEPLSNVRDRELEELRKENASLQRENVLLSKLVKKYEDEEAEKNVPMEMDTPTGEGQSAQPVDYGARDQR